MQTTKNQKSADPLARTYTDKEVRRMADEASGDLRCILAFIHEQRSNSSLLKEVKEVLASHSVKGDKALELIAHSTEKKLLYMDVTSNGTFLTLTENAKAVLSQIYDRTIR
ncbi:MAG: hypothetical protein KGH58_04075 [Candidatus Micrarchaeota archaeon]|nr:hypothetical protein [Candidatus Micrarchaeota archaeon]